MYTGVIAVAFGLCRIINYMVSCQESIVVYRVFEDPVKGKIGALG
jgi:hypothetical protein